MCSINKIYLLTYRKGRLLSNFILHFENVVFGYFIQDNVNNKAFVINLLVLLVTGFVRS